MKIKYSLQTFFGSIWFSFLVGAAESDNVVRATNSGWLLVILAKEASLEVVVGVDDEVTHLAKLVLHFLS